MNFLADEPGWLYGSVSKPLVEKRPTVVPSAGPNQSTTPVTDLVH
jgi:hypothetical protein